MSVFRPRNINRRLVGTATTNATPTGKGSPGNAGQIGPKKVPYFGGFPFGGLGYRFQFGCCGGVFRTNESRCGRTECCQCACCDLFGGYLICCAASVKWIVAPVDAEVARTWYNIGDANTRAQAVTGCTGWFVPSVGQLQNPGYSCLSYWDSGFSGYWSSQAFHNYGCHVGGGGAGSISPKNNVISVRSFRCVTY